MHDRGPVGTTLLQLLVGDVEVDGVVGQVDVDHVAVLDKGDVAALSGLGAQVAHGEAARSAGEAAVGDDGGTRDALHDLGDAVELLHAGAAHRALVADDDSGAGSDLVLVVGLEALLLAVEAHGRAVEGVLVGRHGRGLDERALGGQVAVEHLDTVGDGIGIVLRADDGAVDVLLHVDLGEVLGHGLAVDGHDGTVDGALDGLEDALDAACLVEVHAGDVAVGNHVADDGQLGGSLGDLGPGDGEAQLGRDGGQVEQGVERTADGGEDGHGVIEGGLRHDVAGLDAATDELDHGGAGLAGDEATLSGGSGLQRAAGDLHAQGLAQAAHGVGGAQERADARAGVVLQRALDDLELGGLATQEAGAQVLGEAGLDLVVAGTGGHERGGQVDARGGHEQTGDDLVAAAHVDDAVKAVLTHDLGLAGVGDDLAMGEAVVHAGVTLGQAVADGDGVELDRLTAGLEDALLDLLGELAQGLVARADLVPAVSDGDQGLVGVLEGIDGHARGSEVGLGDGPLERLEFVNCSGHDCSLLAALSLKPHYQT